MLLRDLNSRYTGVENQISLGIGINKRLIGTNAARWSVTFALSSGAGGSFKVSNVNNSLSQGVPIPGSPAVLTFTARDFPGYVAGEFWAVAVTAGITLTVIEVFEIQSLSEGDV